MALKQVSSNHISKTVIQGVNRLASDLEKLANQGLTPKDADAILKTVAEPLINKMKSLAPAKEGRLRGSITVWSGKKVPNRVYVGPSYKWYGMRKNGYRVSSGGSIAHIIEYGTVARVMKKGLRAGGVTQETMQEFKGPSFFRPYKGKSTGVVAARPFIRPALDATKKDIEANLKAKVLDNIIKQASKLNLKTIRNGQR